MSKLNFNGRAGGNFLTLPSVCSEHYDVAPRTRIVEQGNCDDRNAHAGRRRRLRQSAVLAFGHDHARSRPVGRTRRRDDASFRYRRECTPHEINTSDIQDARLTLPEGLTLNPAGRARTAKPARVRRSGSGRPMRSSCPPGSKIGTVTIETDLPPGSLTGNVYLGERRGWPDHGASVHDLP